MNSWLSRYGHFIELGVNVALPLAGIFFFHWSVGDIFLLFFAELLYIGGFACLKILLALKTPGFFARLGRMFGFILAFIFVYIITLIVAGNFFDGAREEMITTVGRETFLVLLGNYAAGFLLNYIGSGKFRQTDSKAIFKETLGRLGALLGILFLVLLPLGLIVPHSGVNYLLATGLILAKNAADYFLVYRKK